MPVLRLQLARAAQRAGSDGYIDALIADLESALPLIWGRRVQTVFMGGTPSLFSPAHIDRLLRALDARLKLNPDAEITWKPTPARWKSPNSPAIARRGEWLSIGVQSFDPGHLSALGRIHGADEARRAAEQASRHFDTFNLDIMYALPGQTLEQALADIEQALALGARHLSAYHLTLEPNTLFAARPPANLPDDDLAADMQRPSRRGWRRLVVHYETSAFALPGHQARHNLNYWTFGDYLGIGAGARQTVVSRPHPARYAPQTTGSLSGRRGAGQPGADQPAGGAR